MLCLRPRPADLRDGITRRRWLQVGLGGTAWAMGTSPRAGLGGDVVPGFGRAKSCIFIYLFGGPSQLDVWDLKPDAPDGIRGEFRPIPTNVPGLAISEHLPRLARMADKYTVVRSMTHGDAAHGSSGHIMMTGRKPRALGEVGPTPEDFPTYGSVVTRLRPPKTALPPYVTLPWVVTTSTAVVPGHAGGFLGHSADPFRVSAPAGSFDFAPPELNRDPLVTSARLDARRSLRTALESDRVIGHPRASADAEAIYRRAFDLFGNPAVAEAFRIDREDPRLRERYGMNPFGQSLILARRLAEAGVPMITVYWPERTEREAFNNNGTIDPVAVPAWDTHGSRVGASANFPLLKNHLLPALDIGSSALLEDLSARGRLGETLVVWTGEFGRSPRVNGDAGRDHYGNVFSLMMAGGGIRGGYVHGSSDKIAAFPGSDPVAPAQFAATLYHCLGIRPDTEIRDGLNRPYRLVEGEPVRAWLEG